MVAALSMVSFADLTPARGTLLYSAPESQWRALTGYDDTPYGFAADTWSIGVIIFEVAAAEKFCKLVPDNTSHAAAIISVLWQRLGAPPLEGPWTNTKAGAEWIAGYVVDDSTNAVSPLCEIVSPARDLLSMLVKWVPAARASAAVAMKCAWFGETVDQTEVAPPATATTHHGQRSSTTDGTPPAAATQGDGTPAAGHDSSSRSSSGSTKYGNNGRCSSDTPAANSQAILVSVPQTPLTNTSSCSRGVCFQAAGRQSY